MKSKSSIKICHTERDKREVSKTRESNKPSESRTEKRIDELDKRIDSQDSPVQHCDSSNLMSSVLDSSLVSLAQNDDEMVDSRVLDSSLRALRFAQNDEIKA